mgnify:CR=1 FL=1|tara:strand:- start:597 stop:1325 length:729 start_codon:yes stop_codon:yes gene_type:complete
MGVEVAVAAAVVGLYSANKASSQMGRAQNAQAQITREQLEFQKEQHALLQEQKERYRAFRFVNPYEGMTNPYAGLENTMEDLRVNTMAAEFQMEQGSQQRANILDSLRNVAGSSGIAGLATALSNQGVLQARQVSNEIAQQESRNEIMRANAAMSLQQLDRKGETMADQMQRQGEAMVQQMEAQRQSTLLGVAYQGAAGANQAVQQSFANQMALDMGAAQMQMQQAQAFMNMGTTVATNIEG